MEPATAEDFRENITRGGNALSGGAPYSNSEGLPHRFSPGCGAPGHTAEATGSDPVKQKQDDFDDAIFEREPAYTQLLTSGSPPPITFYRKHLQGSTAEPQISARCARSI
jgi:hypothetical protein